MNYRTATARSHPNIAVIKYWGKRNVELNLPAVPSVSLTLNKFHTTTSVTWGHSSDEFKLNGQSCTLDEGKKVFQFLDLIHPKRPKCFVVSENNFPTAAGLASSSSAFSALAMAGCEAAQVHYTPKSLSVLARQGSGSASRSIWGGWVEWQMGELTSGLDSHGIPIAPPEHWDLSMVIAVVSDAKKTISSRAGMLDTARTSPMYDAWCKTGPNDVQIARKAIVERNLHQLGQQMEISTLKMFSTMFTTQPSIRYWKPQTLAVVESIEQLRNDGIPCWYTMDAGPNVKILAKRSDADRIESAISPLVKTTHILEPGSGTHLI